LATVPDQAIQSQLAERAFRAAEYDFSRLLTPAGRIETRPERHGLRLAIASTRELPDGALDALLAWRLGQYLLTGFYDPARVQELGMAREPSESVHAGDWHALAIDGEGELVCYLTLKQPAGIDEGAWMYRDRDRPKFPCEEVHGRTWQNRVGGVDQVDLASCWELARFVKDQRRGKSPDALRAPLEIGLAVARLARHPTWQSRLKLVTGDFDPEVALRNVRFFFIPVATFAPHSVELPAGHPLAPRYRDHVTAPFLATAADTDYSAYIRWADINIALSCDDGEAAMRLLTMRQFVSVKESSLKRPLPMTEDTTYPVEALTSASSKEASAALWNSAQRKSIPWRALVLGPGEHLPFDQVSWIIDGYVQALMWGPSGQGHLAGLGPEVAFVPHPDLVGNISALEAATPVRVLSTSREHFEEYWRRRQELFESSTVELYGVPGLATAG
jgi:hypothetical protein